ncbi:MAG: S41 family peptidase [Dysgonamonadaceae bacterium]|nr:S41 family peptidase [Dysgonamonadaceae bacterium]MDD4728174.1 S41 family peptidase [Dysgonamonadaceae bacterium]
MKKLLLFTVSLIIGLPSFSQSSKPKSNDRYFNINKNIDILTTILKEIDLFYVDSLEVDNVVNKTINSMLAQLDPYTNYIAEEDMEDLQFMTTGEYAGIGSVISYKDSSVIINEPYEGLPADKSGLKAGDIILEVDKKDVRNSTVQEVSELLKGTPGTSLMIKIKRPGEIKDREVNVTREKISIHPISYSALVSNNIGYMHFSTFTENGAQEVKNTVLDLKKQGAESLILDLRGNGGGIMEEAVRIVNIFVPKGQEVVSTKGKVKQWDRVVRTNEQPVDSIIPLVVLVDNTSASASEIVAGTLQDLDRAVIIGDRSFGKGLVQTVRELPFGGSLKVTTSKYYTPSGRGIQALDYTHRNPDGSVGRIPDSLTTVFHTVNGREVRDGGGITPDIIIEENKPGTISYYLLMENIVFDFATEWVQKHPTISPVKDFIFADEEYSKFKSFVKKTDFEYDRISAKTLKSLEEVMEFEGYMKTASEEFKALQNKLTPNLDLDLETFKDEIKGLISSEIVKRYYYKTGAVQESLKTDKTFEKAVEVLKDQALYKQTLEPTPKNIPSAAEMKETLKKQYSEK